MIKEKYTNQKIAKELKDTAMGRAYHGNALYVAVDIPFIRDNQEYRQVIIRYMTGKDLLGGDHCTLQEIANKLNALEEPTEPKDPHRFLPRWWR